MRHPWMSFINITKRPACPAGGGFIHMKLEKNSRQPLYVQLMTELKQLIRSGKYAAGDKIPTEPELAEIYGVSRITVRKTIDELCKEGYLVKQQGKGTFVEAPKIHRKVEMKKSVSFSETCRAHGGVPSSHVISSELTHPEKWQKEFLGLSDQDELIVIRRIMGIDDVPIMLETIYLPKKYFDGIEATRLENGSLYSMLSEQYGVSEAPQSDSTIEVGTADRECAELLDILPGEPLIIMNNYQYDDKGQPLFISSDRIVGSRYRITI